MKNKHILRYLPFIFPLFLFLVACGQNRPTEDVPSIITANTDPPVQMFVYTPRNLLDENIISEFNELTDISVIQIYYDSDEELISLLSSPSETVSLIIASNYAASVLRDQALLATFDPPTVPNLLNIDGRFRNLAYDPNNQFCAAYTYGTIGLGYVNGQGISATSWNDLFHLSPDSPAYGRTTLLNHPREAMGAALIHLGHSVNTLEVAEINEAKQLIIDATQSFSGLDSQTYWEDLALFNTSLAQGFSRHFLSSQQINSETNYVIPAEGTLLRIYNYCIYKGAPDNHKLAAETFINLALEPEWAGNSVFLLEMPTTVMGTEDLVALVSQQDPMVYPPNEVLANSQYVYSLGGQEILYTTAWEEIINALGE